MQFYWKCNFYFLSAFSKQFKRIVTQTAPGHWAGYPPVQCNASQAGDSCDSCDSWTPAWSLAMQVFVGTWAAHLTITATEIWAKQISAAVAFKRTNNFIVCSSTFPPAGHDVGLLHFPNLGRYHRPCSPLHVHRTDCSAADMQTRRSLHPSVWVLGVVRRDTMGFVWVMEKCSPQLNMPGAPASTLPGLCRQRDLNWSSLVC